jgi:mannose-6-phosphate isomerase-like protein (cupin superfamily)
MRTTSRLLLWMLASACFLGSAYAQVGPPTPADTSLFRGNVFELQQKQPLPYEENFSSLPLVRNETQSASMVQIRQKMSLHYHIVSNEIVYVIKGRGIMTVGSEIRPIQPGDVITIPRGVAHSVGNRSLEPLVALSVMSPPFDGKDRIFIKE